MSFDFEEIMQQTLRRMQDTAKTAVSSSYDVHRSSSGEVVVRRSDTPWPSHAKAGDVPTRKTGTG
jgi:hypothetical protein